MTFEHYIYAGTKRLRCGYTTGSCAALAAKAATRMLLGGAPVKTESIQTPYGLPVCVDLIDAEILADRCFCSVQKDAGDDIDATDGLLIHASVCRSEVPGVGIKAGKGVGQVSQPGLDQPVGEAAINSAPRRMITHEVLSVCEEWDYSGGIEVTISVPKGEKVAQKTFNPSLGIQGGISILGTTGIVEPRSLSALRESVELEIRQASAMGAKNLVLVPGNYGLAYAKTLPVLAQYPLVSCANFIGDALDYASRYEYEKVFLVGHMGKLVKLAGGIMDTHSRVADCRSELIGVYAAAEGGSQELVRQLLGSVTTDACLDILKENNLFIPVMKSLGAAIDRSLERRVAGVYEIGTIVFSKQQGELYRTPRIKSMLGMREEF